MRIIIIFFLSLAVFSFVNMNTSITLQQAMDQNLVKVKVKSLGGYQGETASMEIQNLTKNDLDIKVEPGRRLKSDKDEYQDLLVVREQEILVKANSRTTKNITGYCCESSDSGPASN